MINKGDYAINSSVDFNSSAITTLTYYNNSVYYPTVAKSVDGKFYTGLMQPSEVQSWNYTDGTNAAPTTPTSLTFTKNANNTWTATCSGSTDLDDDTIYYMFYNGSTTATMTLKQNLTSITWTFNESYNVYTYIKCAATDGFGGISGNTTATLVYSAMGYCGDGIAQDEEWCDVFDYHSPYTPYCTSYNSTFKSGPLYCDATCNIDTTYCTKAASGNNKICVNNTNGWAIGGTIMALLGVGIGIFVVMQFLNKGATDSNGVVQGFLKVAVPAFVVIGIVIALATIVLGQIC